MPDQNSKQIPELLESLKDFRASILKALAHIEVEVHALQLATARTDPGVLSERQMQDFRSRAGFQYSRFEAHYESSISPVRSDHD